MISVQRPSICAVIVSWNSRDDVLEALRSLREQTDMELPIVVVDNGSRDGSVAAMRAAFPDIVVLETGENLGFAEGCNRGITLAEADWLLLFNNDAVAERDFVERLRKAAADAGQDVGMIQPRIVFRQRPDLINSSGVVVFANGVIRDRHFAEPVANALVPAEPFCTTAGAGLYRRAMLEQMRTPSGYLDKEYFMYFEDVDLGWRCRLAGWRTLYVPDAVVRHRFQASASRRGENFVRFQCYTNRLVTLVKNASFVMLARTLPRTLIDMIQMIRLGGPSRFVRTLKRLPGALRERWASRRLRRIGRRELERTWMVAPEHPAPELLLEQPPEGRQ